MGKSHIPCLLPHCFVPPWSMGAPWKRSTGAAGSTAGPSLRSIIMDSKAKQHTDALYSDWWHPLLCSQLLEQAGNLLCPLVSKGFTPTLFADVVGCGFFPHSLAEMLQNCCTVQSEALCCSLWCHGENWSHVFREKRLLSIKLSWWCSQQLAQTKQ